MTRTIWSILLLVLISGPAHAQLAPGDVAIVGFWSDTIPSPRSFFFVALRDIDAGSTISFTDKGWLAAGNFRPTEGVTSFTVPSGGLSAGTVVSMLGDLGGFALSTSGDQVFAYEGTIDGSGILTGTLLYGFHDNGFGWDGDATSTSTSALPPSLIGANVAMNPELDNCAYQGPTSGSPEELLSLINDPANWTGNNSTQPSPPSSFSVNATSVDAPALRAILHLDSYPNPFNPHTTIHFELATPEQVSLTVFDLQGRLVRMLLDHTVAPEGRSRVSWDGRDDSGRRVASGAYLYRLDTARESDSMKFVLLK